MTSISVDTHGWTAVPRSSSAFLSDCDSKNTKPVNVTDIKLPSSDIAQKTLSYAKEHLPEPAFNHSLRVFYYGLALPRLVFNMTEH
jgi:cyanamide hydratase